MSTYFVFHFRRHLYRDSGRAAAEIFRLEDTLTHSAPRLVRLAVSMGAPRRAQSAHLARTLSCPPATPPSTPAHTHPYAAEDAFGARLLRDW